MSVVHGIKGTRKLFMMQFKLSLLRLFRATMFGVETGPRAQSLATQPRSFPPRPRKFAQIHFALIAKSQQDMSLVM
jgi:hypothetical protein